MTSTRDQTGETFRRREQLKAQRDDVAEKMEAFEYRKATERFEAELKRNMLVAEAGGRLSLDMLREVIPRLNSSMCPRSSLSKWFFERVSRWLFSRAFSFRVLLWSFVDKLALVAKYNVLRSFREGGYARHSGQPKPHDEYSTPVGNHIHPRLTNAPQSSNPGDARALDPLPSHQEIPFTPMVLPQRVIEPLNTTSNMSALKGKRKLDTQVDDQSEGGSPKRTRFLGAHGHSQNGQVQPGKKPQDLIVTDKAKPSTHRPSHKTRTIDFNEVYQDGYAKYKYLIPQYPPGDDGEGNWWILKCDEHGVFFNRNPLYGAAEHLHSAQHNNMPKEHVLAIQELGYKVWDCSKELANKNNEAVKMAFMDGDRCKPFGGNRLGKRRSTCFADSKPIPTRRTRMTAAFKRRKVASDSVNVGPSKDCTGVFYPIVAELYVGYWGKNKTRYMVILLPWVDLGPAGLDGTLPDTGLLRRPPKCYTIDEATRQITGWPEGFEDGGRLVTQRQFPVMYFGNVRKFGWLRARDLSIFNFEDPDAHSILHYHKARNHYASMQRQRFESYQYMKDNYAASEPPPKLSSSVRQPPPLSQTPEALPTSFGTDNAAVQSEDDVSQMDGDKSPRPEGSAKVNGHEGQVDVEMLDVSRADDTESYHDSADSNVLESDDDMEMGNNVEGSGASVSNNKGLDVPSATTTTEKQPADPPADSCDVSAAKTPAMASPGIKGSVENAGHDMDKETVPAVIQITEDAFITVKEAADRVSSGRTSGGSAGRESESSSGAGFDTRKVVKINAHSRSSKASESPSLAAATLAIIGAAPPRVAAASTPTVLRPDEAAQANRWRAVRSDSGPQVLVSPQPQKSGGAASAAGSATSALKEPYTEAPVPSVEIQDNVAATSRTRTPFSGKMGSEEVFEISCYKTNSGGKFHEYKDGPFLRLVVDKQANTCQTSPGQSVEVKINPHDIARVDVTGLDESPDAYMVSLVLKDEAEGPKKQQLVFEGSNGIGRICARHFCAWATRANPLIDYRNQSHNSSRPAMPYTRN